MTHYGLNPSFVYNSPLPLFRNLVRRGKRFEVIDTQGRPTGQPSLLADTGYPVPNGQLHGVRISETNLGALACFGGVKLKVAPSGMTYAVSSTWGIDSGVEMVSSSAAQFSGRWHDPSMAALKGLRPSVLRTLDWQMTNKRPEWPALPVSEYAPLQGTDRGMSAALQAEAANRLRCNLWWCAPPRFELAVADYEVRLEEMLQNIADTVNFAPILEYGNELWNEGFAVNGWLKAQASGGHPSATPNWHTAAAQEIETLKRVADRVFGPPGPLGAQPYYLFVGGQLTVPSHLDKILAALAEMGVVPDVAGPALYVTPLKSQKEEWEATKAVPTQEELRSSCLKRLEEIMPTIQEPTDAFGPLRAHGLLCGKYSVPYFACYEAGQSLIAGSHPWRKAALEAQRTEWMGELYRGIRDAAEDAGVDLLNWYSAATDQAPTDPRVDVFGLLEGDTSRALLPKALAARGE